MAEYVPIYPCISCTFWNGFDILLSGTTPWGVGAGLLKMSEGPAGIFDTPKRRGKGRGDLD